MSVTLAKPSDKRTTRRVTDEFRTRIVNRGGTLHKFTVSYDPGYNYTILTAHVWTGYEWQLRHRIEVY